MFFIYLMTIEDEQERKTIEELYEKYKYQCLHMAMKYTKNQDSAEDIVQETFIRIIKHRKKYLQLPSSDFEKLLVVIVRNIGIDYYRKDKKEPKDVYDFEFEVEADEMSLEDKVILNEELKNVLKCVDSFDEDTKTVLSYRCMNIPVKTIADMMGLQSKTVEMKLYRARKKLKEMLEGDGLFD